MYMTTGTEKRLNDFIDRIEEKISNFMLDTTNRLTRVEIKIDTLEKANANKKDWAKWVIPVMLTVFGLCLTIYSKFGG